MLQTLNKSDYTQYQQALAQPAWTVACFCAAWCTACRQWQPIFQTLATQYDDMRFLWIDVEDHADLLGDLDVENFPTISIEYDGTVLFFGAIHPDDAILKRLIANQRELSLEQIKALANKSAERSLWQKTACLKKMFEAL